MKKNILLTALLSLIMMESNAIENKFQNGFDFIPSTQNISSNSNISMMEDKVVFFKNDSAFSSEIADSLDLIQAKPIKGIEKLGIEGQFGYEKKTQTIYLSSKGKLYSSNKTTNGVWSKPQPLVIEGLSGRRTTQRGSSFAYRRWRYKTNDIDGLYNPFFSNNHNRLYFSADLEEGKGGRDIWFIEKKNDNTWSHPQNVNEINSDKDEDYPFLYKDSTFYFSSNRQDSVQGSNIFRFDLKSNDEVKRLPMNMNSNSNDINFVGTNKCIFLVSDRNGKTEIIRPNPIRPTETKDTTANDSIKDAPKVVIKDFNTCIFYFEFDNDILINSYEKEFEIIMDFINNIPNSRFEITGHTDERGGDKYNMLLSKKRAKKVYEILVEKGIKESILKYNGKGETQPEIKNAQTEEEHQKNRRVEIKRIEQ